MSEAKGKEWTGRRVLSVIGKAAVGLVGLWSGAITIVGEHDAQLTGFMAWTLDNSWWMFPLAALGCGFWAGWSLRRRRMTREGVTAERIAELEAERDDAVRRSVNPSRFAEFKAWERETEEFMAMPRDRKQLILELLDGEQRRVEKDDRRRMNAAELLNAQGYLDYRDEDESARVFQISAATRARIRRKPAEWAAALEEDGLPDEGIFSEGNRLEYDEPVSFRVTGWKRPGIFDFLDEYEKGLEGQE